MHNYLKCTVDTPIGGLRAFFQEESSTNGESPPLIRAWSIDQHLEVRAILPQPLEVQWVRHAGRVPRPLHCSLPPDRSKDVVNDRRVWKTWYNLLNCVFGVALQLSVGLPLASMRHRCVVVVQQRAPDVVIIICDPVLGYDGWAPIVTLMTVAATKHRATILQGIFVSSFPLGVGEAI